LIFQKAVFITSLLMGNGEQNQVFAHTDKMGPW